MIYVAPGPGIDQHRSCNLLICPCGSIREKKYKSTVLKIATPADC
jgi:hypothetical protein